jgi:PAS domain S-box-containing protein
VVRQDVSARKRTEEKLRAAHSEAEQLLASISSVLIGVAEDDRVRRWNHVAETTFGLPAGQVLGRPFRDCGIRWDWKTVSAHIAHCRAENRTVRSEPLRFRRPDGTEGFLGVVVNPVNRARGRSAGVLLVAADITERKILESQLAHAQKLESIGQLAAGIAHEINTPTQFVGDNTRFLRDAFADLQTLLVKYGELLEAGRGGRVDSELVAEVDQAAQQAELDYLRAEIPQAIAQSLEGIERVAKIVRAMKDFSHPGGEEKQAVDLNRSIESTVTVARNEWKYVADLVTDFDPTLPPVPCLIGDLNQAVLNIVINAAHAIGEVVGDGSAGKGRITIETRRGGAWAEIRVSDTGPGIPEAIRSKIFDPFFTTKEVGKGTGQGLAIAHAVVVDKHGGTIGIETETGCGTTVVIRLPIEPETLTPVGALADETPHPLC